jgi:hypothetical protein
VVQRGEGLNREPGNKAVLKLACLPVQIVVDPDDIVHEFAVIGFQQVCEQQWIAIGMASIDVHVHLHDGYVRRILNSVEALCRPPGDLADYFAFLFRNFPIDDDHFILLLMKEYEVWLVLKST